MSKIDFYRDIVKFNTPNVFKPSLKLNNAESSKDLEFLNKNGYVIFHKKFDKLADYLNNTYVEPYLNGRKLAPKAVDLINGADMSKESDGKGLVLSMYISFSDAALEPLLCDEDLLSVIYNYYKRQPYYRNQPHLLVDKYGREIQEGISSKYHLDGNMHQLSVILLLEDTTPSHTHTKFAAGSHTKYRYKESSDRYSFKDTDVEKDFRIDNLCGPKGSVLVFDAGNGFHKISEQPDSVRKMFFINITCGSHISSTRLDKYSDIAYLKNKPAYVKNLFLKATQS